MKIFLAIILLSMGHLRAQNDSLPFINDSLNIIMNAKGLDKFISAIQNYKSGGIQDLSIVHIGDSHVQAGFYSEPIRKTFQGKYGNAGRGLVFPYQATKTNGPADYSFSSLQVWKTRRNSIEKGNLPTGIAGHTAYNSQKISSLIFKPRDKVMIGKPQVVEIYHESIADSNYCYQITDSLGNKIGVFDSLKSNNQKSVFKISPNGYQWAISPDFENNQGKSSTIFGVNLINQAGLLMHTIGVNGAEYEHYLRSEYFNNQLPSLKPNLIIVSLGTNEAYNTKDFDPIIFEAIVDSFITITKANNPEASILIASPPSIGQVAVTRNKKRRKVYNYTENKNIPIICGILENQAVKHQCSYWNFYAVMGGFNSINKWYAKGMTDKRRIHFSKKGYLIQGGLLNRALNSEIEKKIK